MMHMKSWISPLFAALLCVFCLPVYGAKYVVVMKIQASTEQLTEIISKAPLFQAWKRLYLIPAANPEQLTHIFEQEIPDTSLKEITFKSDYKGFIGEDSNGALYVGWFFQTFYTSTADAYAQALSYSPIPPASNDIQAPISKILKGPTSAGRTPLTIKFPTLQESHTYTLSRNTHGHYMEYTTLPLLASESPLSLIFRGENLSLPINSLKEKGIQQRTELSRWTKKKEIYSGNFGDIELYQHPYHSDHQVIVKKIQSDSSQYSYLSREAIILDELEHEHIIRFEGITTHPIDATKQELWVALEYIPDRDMALLIKNNPDALTEQNIQKILQDIASAILYLHGRKIAHRDIKPDNILLILNNGTVISAKLADFGLAHCTTPTGTFTHPCGSPMYSAPELLRGGTHQYIEKADIWSYGALIHVSFTRNTNLYPEAPQKNSRRFQAWRVKNTHKGVGSEETKKKFTEAQFPTSPPSGTADLIQHCCNTAPEQRPSIEEILQNPFFASGSNPIKD